MYIETSSPRNKGDVARLKKTMPFSGNMCLSFYYHMYGSTMGTLNVYVNGVKVFSASGNKGNNWRKAELTVTSSGMYEVRTISKAT